MTNYNKAAQLDPTHAGQYMFNTGAVLTNAGKVDDAIAAFDKVIAADPTKADAYYWKGVNLIGKATLKGRQDGRSGGHGGSLPEVSGIGSPPDRYAQPAKDMLASIGASVETDFGTKKKAARRSSSAGHRMSGGPVFGPPFLLAARRFRPVGNSGRGY